MSDTTPDFVITSGAGYQSTSDDTAQWLLKVSAQLAGEPVPASNTAEMEAQAKADIPEIIGALLGYAKTCGLDVDQMIDKGKELTPED